MHDLETTLVAVGTAPGMGGIGCLRLSGPDAEPIALRLFRSSDRRETPGADRRLYFGRFVDASGQALDHGFLVIFRPKRSYTGEPAAELWSHGSPAVLAELVTAAIEAGATPAGPGEFTYRAVRNGRLDLARAEAVRDLIEARTGYQARVAFAQAEGSISRRLQPLCDRLEDWIARIEAAVEFVDESDTHLPGDALGRGIARILKECRSLLDGFLAGRIVRTGATMAIIGRPNVGKSSLFNRLLERDRAIVTEVAGTTRDTLEEQIELSGIPVRLIDTAGLRSVVDPIESEGVRRARSAHQQADLVLLVLDRSRALHDQENEALRQAGSERERARTLVVRNKADLDPHPRGLDSSVLPLDVSAATGEGLDLLREEMKRRLVGTSVLEDPIVTNARHGAAIENACRDLEKAADANRRGFSEELVLEDLRRARRHLGEIRGELTDDALYDRIFSTFCIGK